MTDLYEEKVTVVRCRRSNCKSAFRHCPEGIDRGGQTQRMGGARVGAWTVAALREPPSLAAFSVSVSRMSARRDVHEAGRNARGKQAGGARGTRTVTGADETVVRVKGETTVAGVVTDAATGQVLGLEVLVKRDSDGFIERLCDFARDCEGRGAGHGRPEYVQADGRASGNRPSDLHSPRE